MNFLDFSHQPNNTPLLKLQLAEQRLQQQLKDHMSQDFVKPHVWYDLNDMVDEVEWRLEMVTVL